MRLRIAAKFILFLFMTSTMLLTFQNCSQTPMKFSPSRDLSSLNFCKDNPTDPSCLPIPNPICTFNGSVVSEGQFITAYQNSTVPFGSSCASESRSCVSGVLSGSFNYSSCSVGQPSSCLFNGQTVAHGESIQGFLNSTVPFGETCSQETRTCVNGMLSGTFNYGSCSIGSPSNCLFNGQTVAHGSTVSAFPNSTVPFGQTCIVEARLCNNGNLSGSGSFASCSVGTPASCTFNGQNVAHGQSVTAFQNSTVSFGASCTSQQRTCNNGTLTGSYQYVTCTPDAPASCQFNGRQIAHRETVKAYQNSTVPFGQTCVEEDRLCTDGTLSGSYNFGSCTPGAPANCTFNGSTVNHGQSVVTYATSSVPFGSTCSGVTRTCNNGTLSGSGSFSSCNVGAPADCILSGQTVAHGQSISAFQSSTVPYGETCTPQSRTCSNGALSGSAAFNHLSCNVGAPASCSFNGQPVAHGQSVTAYASQSVPYGNQCSSTSLTCSNGLMVGDTTYTYSNCQVDSPIFNIAVTSPTVDEGQTVTFEVTAVGIADGTSFIYSLSGTNINANDFVSGTTSGQVTFTNGKGTVSLVIRADQTTEGSETLTFNFFNAEGIVAAQKSIQINDTSQSPDGGSLSGPDSIGEGVLAVFVLKTNNIPDGTNVSYCYDISGTTGRTNPNDFNGGCSGSAIYGNSLNIPVEAYADYVTEGDEISSVRVTANGVLLAQATFTVLDTSKTPMGTLSGPSTMNEGQDTTFILNTQNVKDGVVASLCFDTSGTTGRTNHLDFPSCYYVTVTNNQATFIVQAAADRLTEGNESTFARAFIIGSQISQLNLTVIDTSK